MSSDADRVMRVLAVWDGADPAAVDRSGVSTPDLIGAARRHRLVGVLAAAVEAGAVDLEPEDRELVARGHTDAMGEVLLLEDVMLDALDVLDRAGLDHRLLKGSALAHTAYADPSERSFGDTDLLVRSSQLEAAVVALTAAGGQRPIPPLTADFDRRFAKSVTLRWLHDTELDLHRTLAPGPFGIRIGIEDLWEPPRRFELAGRAVDTLSPELHLLHGAYHVVLGGPEARYGNVRDLITLIGSDLDLDSVIATAERWRGQAVLAEATNMVEGLGGSSGELARWAERVRIPARDRRVLRAHRTRGSRFRRQALLMLPELPWRDRLAYLRALAFPDRANLEARGGRHPRPR